MRIAPASPCLGEETIAALVGGRLASGTFADAEAHLATCASCTRILADAAHGALWHSGGVEPVADEPSQRWRSGELIAGKYRLDHVLGRGGMGVVLAATHVELGQAVAIKVLHDHGEAAVARFLREARVSARLTSAHVARIFDFGRLQSDGAPYLVMERLVGRDLARVVAGGRLPVSEAVLYVVQAAWALSEAHTAGIIHRDLKPANLFLVEGPSAAGGQPLIKVLDFGISKVVGSAPGHTDDSLALTLTGATLGSPLYMSPEQVRASREVDGRTDIWSLGVILYQLLIGEVPFRGSSASALAVAIATETPLSPSSRRPDLPHGLEAVVLRCLAKRRDDRFSSVGALLAALTPFAGLAAAGPSAAHAGGAPRRQRRRLWVIAAVAAVALVAPVAVFLSLARPLHTGDAAAASPTPALPALVPQASSNPPVSPGSPARPDPPAPLPVVPATAVSVPTRARRIPRPQRSRPALSATGPDAPAAAAPASPGPLDTPD